MSISTPLVVQQQLQQVAHFLGLPEQDWLEVDGNIAGSSRTWLHQDWVLQQRPRQRYKRMKCLQGFSWQLDGLFAGFRYHGPIAKIVDDEVVAAQGKFLQAEYLWMAQPRLDGHTLFDHSLSPETVLFNLERAVPVIAKDLDVLAQQKLDFFDLYRSLPTNGLVQQNLKMTILNQLVDTDSRIKELAQQISWPEPQSRLVISHGDPTLKNIVEHNNGFDLVDWESMWLLPRHRDFTHMVAFLAKTIDCRYWDRISQIVWSSAQEFLPDWDQQTWQRAVLWQMLREVIYFPPRDDQQASNYLDGLAIEMQASE